MNIGNVSNHPIDRLRSEHARVMHALVMAMDAAQNWHDIMKAADTMVDVTICHFNPLLREAVRMSTDGAPAAGRATAHPLGSAAQQGER